MLALSITCLLRLPDRGPQVLFHLPEQTRPESLHESWDAIMLPSGWIWGFYVYIYRYTVYIYICRYSIHLRPQLIPMMPFIFHPHFACRNFSATKLPTVLGQHFFHRLTLVNSPALAERRVVPVASSHLFTSLHSFISLLMSIDLCSTKHYQTLFHSWTLRKILSLAAGRVAKFANWWKWCRLVSRPFTSERPHLIRITGMDRWRTVIQGGDIGSCSLVTWPLRWFWGNIL